MIALAVILLLSATTEATAEAEENSDPVETAVPAKGNVEFIRAAQLADEGRAGELLDSEGDDKVLQKKTKGKLFF